MTVTDQPQGFLLLTLPNARLTTPTTKDTGTLSVECITLAPGTSQSESRDVWIVLRLNAFETAILPGQAISHTRSTHTFTFLTAAGNAIITLPVPRDPGAVQDLETFEIILAQYGSLEDTEDVSGFGDGDLKGRLVLVDEDDGEVVGTFADEYTLKEDKGLMESGREQDPVLIELPEDGKEHAELLVQSVPKEQQDMFMKAAGILSRGIVLATGAITSGMSSASSYYIAHSTPTENPIVLSQGTKTGVQYVHGVSGKAVEVTAKTTGLIYDAIGHAVDYVATRKKRTPAPASTSSSVRVPPTLPLKKLHEKSGTTGPSVTAPPVPPRQTPLVQRILLSTDVLLTTLEDSAKQLVEHSTNNLGQALGHKYGPDVAQAVMTIGGTVRNVGVVYIDVRGVGRRVLLKNAGKKYVKAKLGKKEVVLSVDEYGHAVNSEQMPMASGSGAT